MYTRVLFACPLLRGVSSFGVSFIRGFTVHTSVSSFFPASQILEEGTRQLLCFPCITKGPVNKARANLVPRPSSPSPI